MGGRELDAVVVEIVALRAVEAVRHFGDFLAQLGFADVHPGLPAGEHGIDAVFAEQLGEFAQAIGVGVDLRRDVSPGHFRRTGVGADERLDVGIDLAAAKNLERRDQQPFLEQVGGIAAVGTGDLAAEVRLVGDVADEADQPSADEHRRDHGDVGGMVLAGLVGMVDDEGIARLGGVAEAPADLVHLGRQGPDMQRLRNALRDHAPGAVENGEGEILAFLDDGRIARAQHVERELARDLQRRLIDDLKVDGVHAASSARHARESGHPVSAAAVSVGWAKSHITPAAWARRVRDFAHGENSSHAPLPTLRLFTHFTGYAFSSCAK